MKKLEAINYSICLEPDLDRFIFCGKIKILLAAGKPVNEIRLNSCELAYESCTVAENNKFVACPFSLQPKKEEIVITLPRKMSGEIILGLDYTGEINDRMAGFYRSKYISKETTRYLAVTQFEVSDARKAFPCLDHPVKKATFDVEMIIDQQQVAISNMPISEERRRDDGKKWIKFEQTPKMSTYLLFFSVGEFEFITDRQDKRVRAATTPGLSRYAGLSLELGRKSLEFSENYYDSKYPLPKLDLIAISDFAFGAMENWGAVTFRENLLLHFSNITSKPGKQRIFEVIAHEIAHQWFGNLVTPADWKYLWLNESFATYFGYKVVNNYNPDWEEWPQFLHSQTDRALDRDALVKTVSIEIPGEEHIDINEVTAPIIYSKGASILRQIEGYIGQDSFKQGLRQYLKKHAFACASSHHLWESFEQVSSKPVSKMIKEWIEQPGYPLIEVERIEGNKLLLTQKRFTYVINKSTSEWMIPVTIMTYNDKGDSKEITTLMRSKSTEIPVDHDVTTYKANYHQTGFYRVAYKDKSNLDRLGRLVSQKELPAADRWGLQNDLFALVKSNVVTLNDYLDFLTHFSQEDAFLPLIGISGNLYQAYLVLEDEAREKISSAGRTLLQQVLSNIGYTPGPEEKHTTSILRDQLLMPAVLYGSEEAADFTQRKFSALMKGGFIHPDLMKSILQSGALFGKEETFDWLVKKNETSESEHERTNILIALGSFKEERLIKKAQDFILEKVPDRNKFIPLCSMGTNPFAIPNIWEWYCAHITQIEQLHPLHHERVIAAIVPLGGLGKKDNVKSFFEEYLAGKKKARDVILMSLEKLDIYSKMRRVQAQ